jgi:hypothetical protein
MPATPGSVRDFPVPALSLCGQPRSGQFLCFSDLGQWPPDRHHVGRPLPPVCDHTTLQLRFIEVPGVVG